MKALLPLTLVAVALFLIMTAPSTDADEEEPYFVEGCFQYQIQEGNAGVISYIEEAGPEDGNVIIPSTVIHDGKEYTVTMVSGFIDSKKIITLTLPKTLSYLDAGSLTLDNLTDFYVDPENTFFKSIEGVLFDGYEQELIKYPVGRNEESYQVPFTTSIISYGAFMKCNLREIALNKMLVKIGDQAFYISPNLERVYFNPADPRSSPLLSIICDSAFDSCPKLYEIELPSSLESIGTYALSNTAIEKVDLPTQLSYLGDAVFYMCTKLKVIDSNSDKFWVEDGVLYTNEKKLICYPAAKEGDRFVVPQTITSIAPMSFSGCSNLKTIVMNKNITVLEDMTFTWCKSVEEIIMPNVMIVGDWAFEQCGNLKTVQFGKNIYSLGSYAFEDAGIVEIEIPASVVTIGNGCFSQCYNLTRVSFPEECSASVGEFVFSDCFNLKTITINSTNLKFSRDAFCIGNDAKPVTVDVEVVKGYSLPPKITDDYTTLNVKVIGERPYPYENLIAVAFCVVVLIGILALVREV